MGFKQVALVLKRGNAQVAVTARLLLEMLRRQGLSVLVEQSGANLLDVQGVYVSSFEHIGAEADLVVVVGGDGTLLRVIRELACYQVPVVGVNRGRLGFLTDISGSNACQAVSEVLDGKGQLDRRMLLRGRLIRAGKAIFDQIALNDVFVQKGMQGRVVDLELRVDNEPIYRIRSDGVLVAAPTGSTAYNLAAHGPVLYPGLAAFVVTPLNPHLLTTRPIVVPDQCVIEVVLMASSGDSSAYVHFDGQSGSALLVGDRIMIERSQYQAHLLHPADYRYFTVMKDKLGWAGGIEPV